MRGKKTGAYKCSPEVLDRMRDHFRKMTLARKAERLVAKQLRTFRIECHVVACQNLGWDIVAGSLHIEVKAAKLLRGKTQLSRGKRKRLSPRWIISFARGRRHRLQENGVDFYVCYLTGCDDLRPVYLILKAPVRRKQIVLSLRQLLTKFRNDVNAWHKIARSERREICSTEQASHKNRIAGKG